MDFCCRPATPHTHIRWRAPRCFPPEPTHDDGFSEDLAEPEHNTVNERQEHVNGEAGDQRQYPRLRREAGIEDGRRRCGPVVFGTTVWMVFMVFVWLSTLVVSMAV